MTSRPKFTVEQEASSLAHYLPNGKLFAAKNISNSKMRQLLKGLAWEVYRVENKITEIMDEHYIEQTNLLIEEWENAVGIPDGCFNRSGTIEERRQHVIIKLARRIQTRQDFINLAADLGFTVTIENSTSSNWVFNDLFPWTFSSAYSIIVTITGLAANQWVFGDLFPWYFNNGLDNIIICLFEKLKPAHVKFIYVKA